MGIYCNPALTRAKSGDALDTRALFQNIAKGMHADFQSSAQILHSGSKGTVRENVLKQFLEEGRLPERYAIGSGEVVGRVKDTSRQCDLLIYDRENGVTLLYDRDVQVYPIDCVYGIIEVKSALSKGELIDSLEKIKTLKEMAPNEAVDRPLGGGLRMQHARPRPFGMVFAYSLAGNSLESLCQNLSEWGKDIPPSYWPNYICVLNEGVILHKGAHNENCIDSDKISSVCWPIWLAYKEDSLFQFYCALHDICGGMTLGPVQLMRYYQPATRIGKFVVDGPVTFEVDISGERLPATISEKAISKIVEWCKQMEKITLEQLYLKQYGALPVGMRGSRNLGAEMYLYDPLGLPGLHEVEEAFSKDDAGRPVLAKKTLVGTLDLIIDGERYAVPLSCLDDDDVDIRR